MYQRNEILINMVRKNPKWKHKDLLEYDNKMDLK